MVEQQSNDVRVTRKGFLKILAALTITGAFLGNIYMFLRSIKPNVLYEPLKKMLIGKPDIYPEGQVFLPKERLFVVRKGSEFNSVSAVCTHLGCTVKEVKLAKPETITLPNGEQIVQEWEYHCPCHGSKYRSDGTIYDGPAPANLPPLDMKVAPDGDIMVDAGKKVKKDFRLKV